MTELMCVIRALFLLDIWWYASVRALCYGGKLGPRYSLLWQTVGLVNHDRFLTGDRKLLYPDMKKPTV